MKKKTVLKVIALLFGLLFLSVIGYGIYLYNDIRHTANEMYDPLPNREGASPLRSASLQVGEPMSILLTGVDLTEGREDEVVGRADSIMVLTLNPAEGTTKMLSIPRDTRAEIVGRGTVEKINHAHAYGGAQMLIDSIEEAYGIPIDHYASINMAGFERLIDAFGGITVYNDFEFEMDGSHFPEGTIELNGEEALKYTRMRYDDPRGDAGRANRQRDIIDALMQESASLGSITKVGEILDVLGTTVRTDLSLDVMWDYQSEYRPALGSTEQIEVSYTGETIDGIWYAIVSDEEKARVRSEMLSHLGLE
ncbi:LCP family glycopolymer transferase [Shouchella clausii]|uniref:LCP family glycopolymer transferase n=1 Tax=Shouchella clausii TaxID=79880 RepID=UPI0021495EE8|nr:LCP family protein [Shouchella clausii]MCR1287050.1 LCP family protein [Shouchella clausii]